MILTGRHMTCVDRALFGSSNRGAIQGYQMLNWSAGIDARTSKELQQWAPTRLQNDDPNSWTVHCFRLSGNRVCIGRTFIAGYEYSGRGSLNVATVYLVVDSTLYEAYQCDGLAIYFMALALGHFCVHSDFEYGAVAPVTLPANAPMTSEFYVRPLQDDYMADSVHPTPTYDELEYQLRMRKRVAVVGMTDPISYAARLIDRLDPNVRTSLSFTTGLPLSIYRPFQLHFMETSNYHRQHTLVGTMADIVYGVD